MEGHSQLANCVHGKTMALFKPWRYLVSKPPNLDVAKEARILCDVYHVIWLSRLSWKWASLRLSYFPKGPAKRSNILSSVMSVTQTWRSVGKRANDVWPNVNYQLNKASKQVVEKTKEYVLFIDCELFPNKLVAIVTHQLSSWIFYWIFESVNFFSPTFLAHNQHAVLFALIDRFC